MASLEVPTDNRRRRRRVDDDDDDEEQSTRAATPFSQSSNGSKRLRVDDPSEGSDDENEEAEYNLNDVVANPISVFPANQKSKEEFQPGAIVRMKLKNFVTYTQVEYYFGPMLNMIIGPNGTGKSTLVCAICLGLGWGPQHLGRAKDATEFVKHGCKEATIEIELARGPHFRKNPVIRRVIKSTGNQNSFTIDGLHANRKKVQKLAQKFHIQIDNLCQFLPQDKVAEFAALTPVELLYSTQRAAAGPQMLEWQDNLIALRAEQKKLLADNKQERELLANLENRQELQRADVEKIRERAQIKQHIERLESYRPVAAYRDYVLECNGIKARKIQAQNDYKELETRLAPALEAVNAKREYFMQADRLEKYKNKKLEQAERSVKEFVGRMDAHEESVKSLTSQIEAEKKQGTNYKQQQRQVQQKINKITRQMQEKPEEFDISSYTEKIRVLQREIRDLQERAKEIKDGRAPLFERLNERERRLQETKNELQNLDSHSGQREALLKKISPDTFQARRWVLENEDKFEHKVFGPPLIECSVKDPKYADAIESLLQRNDFLAFTTQSLNDFRTLQRALNGELKLHDVSIRNCTTPLSNLKAPISDNELGSLGFDGWAKDYLTGPPEILAMLCNEQFLFRTPITLREITEEEYNQISNHEAINSWVSGQHTYKVTRRREYGPSATSTQARPMRGARYWTDQPLDVSVKQELLDAIQQQEKDVDEVNKEIDERKSEISRIGNECNQKKAEKTELELQKSEKQTAHITFQALPEKLSHEEMKKRDLEDSFQAVVAKVKEFRGKQDQIAIEKAETAITYADAVEALRKVHEDLIQAKIRSIEALSDYQNLEHDNEHIKQTLKQQLNVVEAVAIEYREAGQRKAEIQRKARRAFDVIESEPEMAEMFAAPEYSNMTVVQLEANIDSAKARLTFTHEGNEGLVKEFEDRQRAIDKLRDKMSGYHDKLADHENAIQEIRDQWEPRLDALVKTISDAFSDSFARIGCAGQVSVDKVQDPPGPNGEPGGSDFDQWSIQIQVKFRESENLSILDSHRQSGGERAVSTIFYLMALQSLSASPFRVVDEINQGMDPRNERMVHERMVDIACAPRTAPNTANGAGDVSGVGGSQYFLITPKVLTGLYYAEGIRVQCIASGEHVPTEADVVDFRSCINRMDRINGRPPRAMRSGTAGGTVHGNGLASNSTTLIYA